ncbi:hypothetical protein Saso_74760 [Streptomyces asoensis]|uniref:Uncharacterized protein n=1 Tax=Streptomyces asoensis TaxID=249586 RepID=A0ABQ3SCH5_9ACTN|nr:hypothetical protein GCM10010496_63980 [Streptomyces asoensis]GHI65826.1 hypothetical protein Saso_74760 [Streptomyces asoensis]
MQRTRSSPRQRSPLGNAAIYELLASATTSFSPFLELTATEAHTARDNVAVAWHGSAITRDLKPVNWSGINVLEPPRPRPQWRNAASDSAGHRFPRTSGLRSFRPRVQQQSHARCPPQG